MGSSNGGEEQLKHISDLNKTLKEGVRILPSTRRPDGTLRKPIRMRPGYTPPEEVPKYQSKGALWKKEMESQGPPGYEPEVEAKPKTKAAKRNERKKEKKSQTAAEKGKSCEEGSVKSIKEDPVKLLTSEMEELAVSANPAAASLPPNPAAASPPPNPSEGSDLGIPSEDIDKRIRALKKKIRLAEAQQQKTAVQDMNPEQLEKVSKLEDWRLELKLMEEKKIELTTA